MAGTDVSDRFTFNNVILVGEEQDDKFGLDKDYCWGGGGVV